MSTSSNVHSDSETEESADYRPNHSLDDSLVKPEENNKNKQPEETANSVSSIIQSVLQTRFGNTLDAIKSGSAKLGLAVMVWGMGYFNFSLLWLVCGVSIGMFISEKVRRRKATSEVIKASSDDPKKFAETVKEMFRLNGKEAPSWIYFPDMEKAEWLNRILQQMWPYISDYVKNLVTDKIQSSIQMSSSLLSGFSFTEVDLGNRAPRIAGVKVYGDTVTRRNEIIMDMQIVYDSESNIGVSVNGLQAGISSLIIRGVLRVQLSPLIEKMPIIGAASVSFVRDPTIDFDLTHLANIFDFPGLDSMLRGAVSDCVASLLVLPEKYIVKLSPDVDISRLRFPLPQGILRVEVIEAKNLMEKDKKFLGIGGSSDPYVNVKVGHRPVKKTKTIQHSLNPVWNEYFNFIINDVTQGDILFTLFDDDGALNKADFLGSTRVSVRTVFEKGVIDEMFQLSDVDSGQLHVRLEWFDLSTDSADLDEAVKSLSKNTNNYAAFLNIYVDGAQHLPKNEEDGFDPSTILKIQLPGHELRTKIAESTYNPVWEENFQLLLRDPRFDEVIFQLEEEHSRPGSFGWVKFPTKQLLSAPNMTVEQPFTIQSSGPQSVLNLRLTLRLLKLKKSQVDDTEIISSNSLPTPIVVEEEKSSSHENDSTSNVSATHSTSSLEFVDKTLQSFYEASPDLNSKREIGVHRTVSTSSEMSNVGAVDNLRKRLNAKLKENDSEDEESNSGLGKIQLTIRYRKSSLVVLVVKAEKLIVCDVDHNTSDPYVKLYITPFKNHTKKTRVVKNNLNPEYDQKFEFEVSPKEVNRRKLVVTVKNQTGFLSSEKVLMGQVVIDLSELDLSQSTTEWYPLKLPNET